MNILFLVFSNLVNIAKIFTFILTAANVAVPGKDHTIFAENLSRVIAENSPIFKNDENKTKTISVLVAVGKRESNLELEATGDHGTSFCTFQINSSIGGNDELNKDPYKCGLKAYSFLKWSAKTCPEYPVALYASGPTACENSRAQKISRDRMNLANWILKETEKKIIANSQ